MSLEYTLSIEIPGGFASRDFSGANITVGLVDFGDKYEGGELIVEEIGETSVRTRIVNLGGVLIELL